MGLDAHQERDIELPSTAVDAAVRLPFRPEGISPQVARQAVEWLVDLQSGSATNATRRGLNDWRQQHLIMTELGVISKPSTVGWSLFRLPQSLRTQRWHLRVLFAVAQA